MSNAHLVVITFNPPREAITRVLYTLNKLKLEKQKLADFTSFFANFSANLPFETMSRGHYKILGDETAAAVQLVHKLNT